MHVNHVSFHVVHVISLIHYSLHELIMAGVNNGSAGDQDLQVYSENTLPIPLRSLIGATIHLPRKVLAARSKPRILLEVTATKCVPPIVALVRMSEIMDLQFLCNFHSQIRVVLFS